MKLSRRIVQRTGGISQATHKPNRSELNQKVFRLCDAMNFAETFVASAESANHEVKYCWAGASRVTLSPSIVDVAEGIALSTIRFIQPPLH